MRTYHGKRTEYGCEVTVDDKPLRLRSDLSGAATTTFGWGDVGGNQLSLALLLDFLDNEDKAIRLHDDFEREVVAQLPHDSWTTTDIELAVALAQVGWRRAGHSCDVANGPWSVLENDYPPVAALCGIDATDQSEGPLRWPTTIASSDAGELASLLATPVEVSHETVVNQAYEIWEKNGRFDGRALEDWLNAEARLTAAACKERTRQGIGSRSLEIDSRP